MSAIFAVLYQEPMAAVCDAALAGEGTLIM
jgi:hypothetical protein